MTDNHKRIVFWSISTVCVIVSVWWTFHFPYSRERLYRAIPGNALIVGEHPEIAGRWVTCLKTPAVRGILNAQGVSDEQIEKTIGDPKLTKAIEAFAGRNTVIAYVPALDTSRRPAWLVASWTGAYCQPLRWGWAARKLRDFERIRLDHGRRGWRLKPGKLGNGMHLTLAATEGILLGCLSRDPYGVRYILDRVDGKLPLTMTAERILGDDRDAQSGQDRLWFEWHVEMGGTFRTYESMMGVTLNGEAGSFGWFRADFLPASPVAAAANINDVKTIEELLGNVPDAVAVAGLVEMLAMFPDSPGWDAARTIADTVKEEAGDGSGSFAALLTGDYRGEIAGMMVGSIVAGVRLKDGVSAPEAVGRLLDKLNVDHELSLIPKRMEGDGGVIRLDSTRPGTFKLFPAGQRPAFAGIGDWLIFCTNRKALEKMLAVDRGDTSSWIAGMEGGPGIHVAGDLEATGKAVENAVAAYTLVMDIQAGRKNKDLAARLDMVKAWARIGGTLKTGSFRLHTANGQSEIQFKFTPK
ncbi:hypothetical protein ACFLQU_04120 [Verrucomicrobiota bacterium]